MPIFVVHEHYAERAGLHWDFRLESNYVLLSWVLKRPPPTKVGVKHKAIRVNDHPVSYATFSGEIPEGYGKGTVAIWDDGKLTWENEVSHLIFILYGQKLVGRYTILPFQDYFLLYKLY
jgi:bifunctional non-homologous end joining protein LigD